MPCTGINTNVSNVRSERASDELPYHARNRGTLGKVSSHRSSAWMEDALHTPVFAALQIIGGDGGAAALGAATCLYR